MPSAASELRRGLNAYNMRVGALSAAALGVAMLAATVTGTVPPVAYGAPMWPPNPQPLGAPRAKP